MAEHYRLEVFHQGGVVYRLLFFFVNKHIYTMNRETKEIQIKCSDININVIGITNTYREQVWTDDDEHEDGGYFNYVLKKYDQPKIKVSFDCTVDVELHSGDVYWDGKNKFMSFAPNKLSLINTDVDEFTVPHTIVCIYSRQGY